MSRSPYLSNPNILAHPDRIVQTVALDMAAQESYLAGSPISAEGKLANDATAIGILLYDVHRSIGGRDGTVVISGRIKQDVAAEWSGVTVSKEAKSALVDIAFTGDGARMGGGSWNDMTDRPFYEETSVIELMPETSITATGGEDALPVTVVFETGKTYTVTWDGTDYECAAFDVSGMACVGNPVNAGGSDNGMPFLMIYSAVWGTAVLMATAGTYTVSISTVGEIVFPMNRKYLPNGVIINANFDKEEATVDMTYAEIVAAHSAGNLSAIITGVGQIIQAQIISSPAEGVVYFNGYVPHTAVSGEKNIINGLMLYQVAVLSDNTVIFKVWENGFV